MNKETFLTSIESFPEPLDGLYHLKLSAENMTIHNGGRVSVICQKKFINPKKGGRENLAFSGGSIPFVIQPEEDKVFQASLEKSGVTVEDYNALISAVNTFNQKILNGLKSRLIQEAVVAEETSTHTEVDAE